MRIIAFKPLTTIHLFMLAEHEVYPQYSDSRERALFERFDSGADGGLVGRCGGLKTFSRDETGRTGYQELRKQKVRSRAAMGDVSGSAMGSKEGRAEV
jgi:hypothetical protein